MKKLSLITFVAGSLCACTHKIAAPQKTILQPSNAETAHSFALAPGRYLYQSRCGTCHELKNVRAYTASQWDGILPAMIPKAKLDDLEKQQLIAFIKTQVKE